ncbi:DUF6385 domain-containing protein [Paenibacillus sp. UNC451MF]|uniref:DUF6385 domain-containing protein n=1 Tax=Paenibacillus sp. UNC451MF TaxID=1449063 RepID=UPI00048B0B6B|nr:DUF6385 domain-containing protein [Paenibacillus sp. UNC451MF]
MLAQKTELHGCKKKKSVPRLKKTRCSSKKKCCKKAKLRRHRCVPKKRHSRCHRSITVRKIEKPVTVIADQLDTRDLSAKKDSVQIFGTDSTQIIPILTDKEGRIIVSSNTSNIVFEEESYLNLQVSNRSMNLPPQDTTTKLVMSYAVINRGTSPVVVRTEISPNSSDFSLDQQEVVRPNSVRVFVPNRFLKWTRLSISTEQGTEPTQVDVYFQSQTIGS